MGKLVNMIEERMVIYDGRTITEKGRRFDDDGKRIK